MKKWGFRLFGIVTILLLVFSGNVLAKSDTASQSEIKDQLGITTSQATGITYRTHVQNVGWESNWTTNGYSSGTEGQGLRLEGIEIKLTGDVPDGAMIEYRTHVQNVGWEKYWSNNGNSAGTQGMSLRLEGIQIRLVNMPDYTVEYRTHIENVGWETNWAKDGEKSGTEARGLRLEGIQIRISKEDADLTDYNMVLATAKKALSANYTVYSWTNLQTAIKNNIVTTRSNQADVDAATNAIETAYDALESLTAARVYASAGTYGSSGSQEIVNQDVVVKADGVILQNMYITGNLIISEEVGLGTVTLNNITVSGETYVRGGGKNSIHINGGSYKRITIQETTSGQVRIVAQNVTGLDIIIAEAAGSDELILEGDFDRITVNAPKLKLSTRSGTTIAEMTVARAGAGSQINLDSASRVERLIFNGKADIKGQGAIGEAQVNADSVTYEKAPEKQTVGKTVKIPPIAPPITVTGITLSAADGSTSLVKGKTLQLSTTVLPANAANKNVTWSVVNGTGSATVSSSGLVTGVTTGIVTVNATARDGSGKIGTLSLTVLDSVSGTIATPLAITAGAVNPTFQITLTNDTFTTAATTPGNWTMATGSTGLTVVSITRNSDTQVTINTTGTAAVGSISFTANAGALSKSMASNTVSITVGPIKVSSITVTGTGSATTVTSNGSLQMVATVLPGNAASKGVTWSVTGGTGTASISSTGLLLPTQAGTVTVRATAVDGSAVYGIAVITIQAISPGVIDSATSISIGATNPAIVVTLANDTYSSNAGSTAMWDITTGNTGLTITGVTRNSNTQVTLATSGVAQDGVLSIQAKAAALTKAAASNVITLTMGKITLTGATISGSPVVGNVLTSHLTPSGAGATYQWQRSDNGIDGYSDIDSATSATYTLVNADEGKYIRVVATGTGGYTGAVTSTAVLGVNPATVSPATATFNKAAQTDVVITLNPNGKTVSSISDGTKTLLKDTDYTVTDNTYTFKKEYLAAQINGAVTLTFNMSSGINPIVAITVSGVLPGDAAVTPMTADFVKTSPADLLFTLTLSGRTLTKISCDSTDLVINTDYAVSGNVVTIKKEYLGGKDVGNISLTFVMSGGTSPIATIAVSEDLTAPSFDVDYPKIANITQTSFNLQMKMNEPGTVYYKVLANDATAPSVDEVILANNSITLSGTSEVSQTINSGLSANTDYDIYIVAIDDETTPNKQTNVTKLDVKTIS